MCIWGSMELYIMKILQDIYGIVLEKRNNTYK